MPSAVLSVEGAIRFRNKIDKEIFNLQTTIKNELPLDIENIKLKIENLLYEIYEKLPENKPSYTAWYYSEGGIKDQDHPY